MAKRRTGGGSRKDSEPPWLEWLEHRPVGVSAGGVVAAGWIVLALLYWRRVWSLEVSFFVAVALLTFALGCLSAYAAIVQARGARPNEVLRLPNAWRDFEYYFRWLTPVAFMFGLIFAHYFWH